MSLEPPKEFFWISENGWRCGVLKAFVVGECLLDKCDLDRLGEQRKNGNLHLVVFNEHEMDGTLH